MKTKDGEELLKKLNDVRDLLDIIEGWLEDMDCEMDARGDAISDREARIKELEKKVDELEGELASKGE